jgi:hypothetical protein
LSDDCPIIFKKKREFKKCWTQQNSHKSVVAEDKRGTTTVLTRGDRPGPLTALGCRYFPCLSSLWLASLLINNNNFQNIRFSGSLLECTAFFWTIGIPHGGVVQTPWSKQKLNHGSHPNMKKRGPNVPTLWTPLDHLSRGDQSP